MNFNRYVQYSTTFIETGTHIGESISAALQAGFETVKSVEAWEPFFIRATKRFENDNRVKIFFGKSTDRIEEMIKDIPIPSVFWLDAHPSGPNTAGHDELMAGDKSVEQDNILLKELEIILKHGEHIILIDDQQGYATANLFVDYILKRFTYNFSIEDEVRPGIHYKEKVLICLPASLQVL